MTNHSTDFFVALETKVWQALVDGDASADASMLSDDFLGVYASGRATRAEHAGQLVDGPTVSAYTIHDATIRVVSDDDVLLTYQATFERPGGTPTCWYVSSLWTCFDGTWLNVFSQDTVADPR